MFQSKCAHFNSGGCVDKSKTVVYCLLFYFCSISLTFFNSRSIRIFPYPLTLTFYHLLTKFILAWSVRAVSESVQSARRVEVPWRPYISKVASAGAASALDIGLSNWSLEFITVSLYTMTKSSSVIFIMLFSILFKLERKKISSIFVIFFIAVGLLMFSYESTQFDITGFSLVLTASFISGIRWTLAQLVAQKSDLGLSNPIDLIYHTQPWMILTLLPLSIFIEGVEVAIAKSLFRTHDYLQLCRDLLYLSIGGLLAFCLECSEYLVITTASSLTLSIAGILKEIVTLYLATNFNGDVMLPINAVGLVVCLLGIMLHIAIRATSHIIVCHGRCNFL